MFHAKCSFARTMLELPLLQPPLAAHRRCCALAAMAWGYTIPPQRACRASQASMRCARVAGAYYHCENGSKMSISTKIKKSRISLVGGCSETRISLVPPQNLPFAQIYYVQKHIFLNVHHGLKFNAVWCPKFYTIM